MAHPRPYMDGRDPRRLVGELARFALAEGITVFLIGLPRHLNGKEGIPAQRARRFAEALAQRTPARVELIDEWLSTREAHARLREGGTNSREARERIDSASAAVLLQSWLDGQRAPREHEEPALAPESAAPRSSRYDQPDDDDDDDDEGS